MGSCGPGRRLVWLPQPLHRLSLQERMASALLELHVPHCLGHDQGLQAAEKELPTSSAAPPSLGIASFEAVSTLLNLPCERFPPQASCRRKTTASDLALDCLSSARDNRTETHAEFRSYRSTRL